MNDLRKNAEGYNDPTAYEAIKNVDGIKRGDIYFIEAADSFVGSELRGGRPGVIVSNDTGNHFSSVVEVVYLTTQDKKPLPTHVRIMADKVSTALCEQINSVSVERLGRKMGSCSPEEMAEIDKALAVSIGLPEWVPDETLKEEFASLAEAFREQQEKIEVLGIEKFVLEKKADPERIRLRTERDTYKNLYTSLLERMIGGAANV